MFRRNGCVCFNDGFPRNWKNNFIGRMYLEFNTSYNNHRIIADVIGCSSLSDGRSHIANRIIRLCIMICAAHFELMNSTSYSSITQMNLCTRPIFHVYINMSPENMQPLIGRLFAHSPGINTLANKHAATHTSELYTMKHIELIFRSRYVSECACVRCLQIVRLFTIDAYTHSLTKRGVSDRMLYTYHILYYMPASA